MTVSLLNATEDSHLSSLHHFVNHDYVVNENAPREVPRFSGLLLAANALPNTTPKNGVVTLYNPPHTDCVRAGNVISPHARLLLTRRRE